MPVVRVFHQKNERKSAGATPASAFNSTSKKIRSSARNPYITPRTRPHGVNGNINFSSQSSTFFKTPLSNDDRKRKSFEQQQHIVCAISENLAKETCIAYLDACSPIELSITKQGNGETYSETLAYLETLKPDEILLNEGRRNSQLAQKVVSLHTNIKKIESDIVMGCSGPTTASKKRRPRRGSLARSGRKSIHESDECDSMFGENDNNHNAEPKSSSIVKFGPRSYFDQTKGAEILRRVSRDESYEASVVEEYIILASSHAVLQYSQLCLGANFARGCLRLLINSGGRGRMVIDRPTLLNLEIFANSKTGKTQNFFG